MAAIVLGYDDSPGSRAALEVAVSLAAQYGDDLVVGFGIDPPGGAGEELAEHRAALREVGERAAKHAVELVRDKGVETRIELVDERPVDALLGLAERHDARFVVVGSYGESPLKGAILGSTPHKLLHLSETPVVVVPA